MPSEPSYLVVDWGTTNFRAFAIADEGEVVNELEKPMGLLHVPDAEFAKSLSSVLSSWLGQYQHLPIYMAGMVGSLKGWVNVDYAETSVNAETLITKAHRFELPWGPEACIFPGVCHANNDGVFDVMRGEEVQLFGLARIKDSGCFQAMLPGTHNKHVFFDDGHIQRFSSFLTGELFSVISKTMLLGKGLDASELGKHNKAFLKGLDDGVATTQLSNTLFRSWTHRLFNQLHETEVLDYLSGMLIGNELQEVSGKHFYIVGGSSLSQRYKMACLHLGGDATVVDGNACFISGMNALIDLC